MAEIEIRALRKAFDSTEVLKGVDLTIEEGEFISLVGPSGCGKSTLLRIIAGLEPQSSGEILIDRASVDGVRPSARNLAMVFQSYALYPHLSVFDNIAVPLRMKRLSTLERAPLIGQLLPGRRRIERGIRADVERVAEQLEISSLLKRKPGQLSGGQRQRVAVGRAIVRQPRAFLFDEPLSNLDAKLRVHMRAEIAQLHRKLKTTFIYVTHDQAEAMTMSGRIAVMIGGELIQVGTPAAIYDDPHDIRVAEFVGTPKINSFPGKVRGDGRLEVLGHVLQATTPSVAGDCRVCVRPERIEMSATGALSGTVVHLENLGSEAFVHIGSAGMDTPVVARVNDPRQLPALGAAISYGFAPDAVRAFDAGGKRIATSAAPRVDRPREVAVG
jgi:multiple sugar transport system ATP-binding protein